MKRHYFRNVLVVAGLLAAVACTQGNSPTSPSLTTPGSTAAKPGPGETGNGSPQGSKLVFSFNLIGTPNDYQGGCGDGRRIFVERGDASAQILIQDGNGWAILNCDGTGSSQAVLQSDNLGTLAVYARILGKPDGTLFVCADYVSDAGDALCLLGTIDMKREGGQSRFKIQADELFNAELEDILWTVSTNDDFRIAQFRVYEQ